MMHTPDWLSKSEPVRNDRLRAKGTGYVEKTLVAIAEMTENTVFSDRYATMDGFLQRIDPRVKLIAILLLVVATSFLRDIGFILAIYALTLILAHLSKIELSFFIKRVWLFVPIFSGIVAFPAIFSFITPGQQLVSLMRFDHTISLWVFQFSEIAITKEGALGALLFVSRVATSVSLVMLLALSTRWNELMKSLRVLRVPSVFILVLSMTYRYILILVRIVQDMHLAKKSRTIRYDASTKGLGKERNWVASRIGAVLMKSYVMSDETHSAMISRGFMGEVKK